jgi:hypothetical protein
MYATAELATHPNCKPIAAEAFGGLPEDFGHSSVKKDGLGKG